MAATYLINRTPYKLLNYVSPFEVLFNKTPNYSFLKVFGCACYPYLGPYKKDKLSPKSTKCIFLGYNPLHKGYRCYENSTQKTYISRHVVFHYTIFSDSKWLLSVTNRGCNCSGPLRKRVLQIFCNGPAAATIFFCNGSCKSKEPLLRGTVVTC